MAARGPKPKPRVLDRTRSARVGDADRDPPAEVVADAVALQAWEETVDALEAVGLFHRADRAMIARYATLTAVYQACLSDLRARGMTMKTKTGYEAPSPAATHLLKVAEKLAAMEVNLGLTPRARAGMKITPATQDEEDEALLRAYTAPPA